jgi:hypothetical protein
MSGAELQTVYFPSELKIGVTKRHNELRILLYEFLRFNFAGLARIGSNQFLYWDASDPSSWVSPDGFVCLGSPNERFDSWKVWERGVPEVAVEIVDPVHAEGAWGFEPPRLTWGQKLDAYRLIGVAELVRFESGVPECPLRVWQRAGDRLLERELDRSRAYSANLRGYWLVVPDSKLGITLRLSRDEDGSRLFPTRVEGLSLRAELAEERVRELRAELRARPL